MSAMPVGMRGTAAAATSESRTAPDEEEVAKDAEAAPPRGRRVGRAFLHEGAPRAALGAAPDPLRALGPAGRAGEDGGGFAGHSLRCYFGIGMLPMIALRSSSFQRMPAPMNGDLSPGFRRSSTPPVT